MLVMVADDSGKYMYQRTLPYKVSTRPQHKVEISKRCVFGLHRWYKWSKRPTGCNNNNLLIFKLAQHVSDNYLPIIRNARLWSTACVIMSPATCRSEARSAAARTMCSVCRMLLDKDYCVRCAGCCSTRTTVFGVQDVARQGLLCSVCRMLLDKGYVFGVQDIPRLEEHPAHRTQSPCRRTLGLRPTSSWGHYNTCCKSQSCAPDDGQRIARNMLS